MTLSLRARGWAGASLFVLSSAMLIQTVSAQDAPLDIVISPNRGEQPVQRAGSAITVIRADEIQRSNPASFADLLRGVPGLSVTESGGPAQLSAVFLRGAEGRHTLVMIDGVRIGDPASTGGEFNFGNLVATDIERIEVLRGPQSALYGSDAIGGVINIITRKGRGPMKTTIAVEGGSYGTLSLLAATSGGTKEFSYALSGQFQRATGFSAYGHRIPLLERSYGPFDKDGYTRFAGSVRFAWRPTDTVEMEGGIYSAKSDSKYDAAFAGFGYLPDTPSKASAWLTTAYARVTADAFDGQLRNRITLYANRTERTLNDVQRYNFGFGLTDEHNRYGFTGTRAGIEYQGDLKLGSFGKFTFGGVYERETAHNTVTPGLNSFNAIENNSYRRDTKSLFALHQVTLFDRLDLSLGGRIDAVQGAKTFVTGRATAAYRIEETGTKIRASLGTGAKAPSLYQQFSIYAPTRNGDPALKAESSVGYDIGIDQTLWNGRAMLSATYFQNRIRDMIDFDFNRGVNGPFGPIGQYINIAQANIKGVEVGLDAEFIPSLLRIKA
ncbi:MAG: TonB-dependent receptor plug domain-containing protein, partial [Beijerinckiaceae bacterium]